jgi:hypothetical protein
MNREEKIKELHDHYCKSQLYDDIQEKIEEIESDPVAYYRLRKLVGDIAEGVAEVEIEARAEELVRLVQLTDEELDSERADAGLCCDDFN